MLWGLRPTLGTFGENFFGSTRLGRAMATTLVDVVWDGGGDSGGDGWRNGMETGTAAVTHTGISCAGRAWPGLRPGAAARAFSVGPPCWRARASRRCLRGVTDN